MTVTYLSTHLQRLKEALDLAASKLLKSVGKRGMLTWPFRIEEVLKLIEAIESYKSLLMLALQNDHARLLQKIQRKSVEEHLRLEGLKTMLELQNNNSTKEFTEVKDTLSIIQETGNDALEAVNLLRKHQDTQVSAQKRKDILQCHDG
jgi:hypothetical protein